MLSSYVSLHSQCTLIISVHSPCNSLYTLSLYWCTLSVYFSVPSRCTSMYTLRVRQCTPSVYISVHYQCICQCTRSVYFSVHSKCISVHYQCISVYTLSVHSQCMPSISESNNALYSTWPPVCIYPPTNNDPFPDPVNTTQHNQPLPDYPF